MHSTIFHRDLKVLSGLFPALTLSSTPLTFVYRSLISCSLTTFNCQLHFALQLSSINYSHLRNNRARYKCDRLSPLWEGPRSTSTGRGRGPGVRAFSVFQCFLQSTDVISLNSACDKNIPSKWKVFLWANSLSIQTHRSSARQG